MSLVHSFNLFFFTKENIERVGSAFAASAASIVTPSPPSSSPPSSRQQHPPLMSPPSSSYDPNLKCVRTVEDEEAAAIALALDKSIRRPDDVIPEQLIPTDDLTIVHIQPSVSSLFQFSVCSVVIIPTFQ